MISPLSFIKPLIYLVIILVIAGGLYYITNLKADLAISEINNKQLENAITEQQNVIDKIQKDIARYTANFTPPTAPLTAIANTSLLTCQSPTAIDNSNNAFAITVNGDARPTKYNPFGETITTGVEYSLTNHSAYFINGLKSPSSFTTNTWHHFAVVRNGSNFNVYLNGISGSTGTSSSAVFHSTANPSIGIYGTTSQFPWTGYMDDLRITKGVARYTSNFTAPSSFKLK